GTVEQPRTRMAFTPAPRPRRSAKASANGAAKPAVESNGGGKSARGKATAEGLDEQKLLDILIALRKGDFTPRLRVKWEGTPGRIADTVNELMDAHQRFIREHDRLSRLAGTEGRI